MADVALIAQAVSVAPEGYTIPGAQEIIIKSVTANYDGTAAGGPYVPTLQILAPNNAVVASCPVGSMVAAGSSVDVSWFPRGGLGGGGGGGSAGAGIGATVRLVGNYAVTTGDPGTVILWSETVADTGSPTPFWNSLHPARLTAPVEGWYLSTIRPIWDVISGTPPLEVATYLYKNTETITLAGSFGKEAENPIPTAFTYGGHTHGAFYMQAGDYLIVNAFAEGGGASPTVNLLDNATSITPIPGQFTFWSLSFLGGTVGPQGPAGAGLSSVTDGTHTESAVSEIAFTGAIVSSGGVGIADVTITAGGGGGIVGYGTHTSPVSTAGTTYGTGADLLTSPVSFTADGTSSYLASVWGREITNTSGSAQTAFLFLSLDAAEFSAFSNVTVFAAGLSPCVGSCLIPAPAAGAHTVNVRLITQGGTATVEAGAGGSATSSPIVVTVQQL